VKERVRVLERVLERALAPQREVVLPDQESRPCHCRLWTFPPTDECRLVVAAAAVVAAAVGLLLLAVKLASASAAVAAMAAFVEVVALLLVPAHWRP
jgi:hypothetical protein